MPSTRQEEKLIPTPWHDGRINSFSSFLCCHFIAKSHIPAWNPASTNRNIEQQVRDICDSMQVYNNELSKCHGRKPHCNSSAARELRRVPNHIFSIYFDWFYGQISVQGGNKSTANINSTYYSLIIRLNLRNIVADTVKQLIRFF